MTMAFLSSELMKTGDPVDMERARLIAAMLDSRGGDIPLPENDPTASGSDESAPYETISPVDTSVVHHPGSSDDALQRMQDGFAARYSTTAELGRFHLPDRHHALTHTT